MNTPDFVVVGHVVEDLTPQGSRLGGTATFAAIQAHRLGVSAGIVTHAASTTLDRPELQGIAVAGRASEQTTTFRNTYTPAGRTQRVLSQAEPITGDDVPSDWRKTSILLLGPVCGEDQLEYEDIPTAALIGIGAQGWLRTLDEDGNVQRQLWTEAPFWTGCHILFASDEDLAGDTSQLGRWTEDVPQVVVTEDEHGARIHAGGSWRRIDAFPVHDIDPTGAGDVFAAAYLIRYFETDDIAESARFATAAAACSIEALGVEGIADRATIEDRLAKHPEIVLR